MHPKGHSVLSDTRNHSKEQPKSLDNNSYIAVTIVLLIYPPNSLLEIRSHIFPFFF
jgi:hypothetical protein